MLAWLFVALRYDRYSGYARSWVDRRALSLQWNSRFWLLLKPLFFYWQLTLTPYAITLSSKNLNSFCSCMLESSRLPCDVCIPHLPGCCSLGQSFFLCGDCLLRAGLFPREFPPRSQCGCFCPQKRCCASDTSLSRTCFSHSRQDT